MTQEKKDASSASIDDVQNAIDLLAEIKPLDLSAIKESCIFELKRFINLRGQIDESGNVHLPLMAVSDANKLSTTKKIKEAHELIKSIASVNSEEELDRVLHEIPLTPTNPSEVTYDLDAVIAKCLMMTKVNRPSII